MNILTDFLILVALWLVGIIVTGVVLGTVSAVAIMTAGFIIP